MDEDIEKVSFGNKYKIVISLFSHANSFICAGLLGLRQCLQVRWNLIVTVLKKCLGQKAIDLKGDPAIY